MFRPLSVFNRNRHAPAPRQAGEGDPFAQFHNDMNRLLDDFISDFGAPAWFTGDRGDARPIHVDFKDRGTAIEVEAELPGVDEDDIDVELADNLLTISGEKKVEEEDEEKGYATRSYSSFRRSLSLPFDVDPDAIEARFKNGVLKLTLPKPPELEAKTRKIELRRD
ncbi:MAG: Hsp20/alpha crystallin family protein [Pseudomonadota bacterium]